MWAGACIDMRYDAFSRCHPAVSFGFFAIAIVLSVILVHPAYLAVSAVCAAAYYLALRGAEGRKAVLGMIPLFFVVALLNPLFNILFINGVCSHLKVFIDSHSGEYLSSFG